MEFKNSHKVMSYKYVTLLLSVNPSITKVWEFLKTLHACLHFPGKYWPHIREITLEKVGYFIIKSELL